MNSFGSRNVLEQQQNLYRHASVDNLGIIEGASKIEFKLPTGTRITGQYVGEFENSDFKKAIETPDGRNVINVISPGDTTLLLSNPNNANFSINLTTVNNENEVLLGHMKYDGEKQYIIINDEWKISRAIIENTLSNRSISEREELVVSDDLLLKINLHEDYFKELSPNSILQNVGIRLNDEPWVKFGFTRDELSFVAFAQE